MGGAESKKKVFSSKEDAVVVLKSFISKFMMEHGDDVVVYPYKIKHLFNLYGAMDEQNNYVEIFTPNIEEVIDKIVSAPETETDENLDVYSIIKTIMEDAANETEAISFVEEDTTFCFRAYYED